MHTKTAIGSFMVLFALVMPGCKLQTDRTLTGASASPGPVVSYTNPVNGATNVAVNSAVSAVFSMNMNASSLTSTTFSLTGPWGVVEGLVTASGPNAMFTPYADLATSTTYTAIITPGVSAITGQPLAAEYVWAFTTGTQSDFAPPTVSATVPVANAAGVSPTSTVVITFSEGMSSATLTTTTIMMTGPSGTVSGTVTPGGSLATFTPSAPLAYSSSYAVTVTTGVQDLAGNAMVSTYTWSFATGAAPDLTPPAVINIAPANGTTQVAINTGITAVFSEPVDPATLSPSSVLVEGPTGTISGTVTPGTSTVTFKPLSDLATATTYTVTLVTTIADLSANPLAAPFVWSFSTGGGADTTGPSVLPFRSSPTSTGNGINTSVTLCFDEVIDPASATGTIVKLLGAGSTVVSSKIIVTNNCVSVDPVNNLSANAAYNLMIYAPGVTDLSGNPTGTSGGSGFSTNVTGLLDTAGPSVAYTTPGNLETGASPGVVYAFMNEPVYPPSVSTASFTLTGPGGPVTGSVATEAHLAAFIPAAQLAPNTVYTATLTSAITDMAGNPLAGNYTWTFTTSGASRAVRSTGNDTGKAIAADASGNTFMVGTSGAIPGSTGSGPLYLVKYDSVQSLQWVVQFGGTITGPNVDVSGVAVDKATGDVYVTGSVSGQLDADPAVGGWDIYVMKFDTNGNLLWTKQRGSTSADYGMGIAVDTAGGVYVTGYTAGSFDGTINSGSDDIILIKYDTAGNWQWTRQRGGADYDRGYGLATYDDGMGIIGVYTAGYTFGSIDGNTSQGGGDAVVVSYDSNGNWQWTQQYGTPQSDYATGIAVDGNGNIYFAGYTWGNFEPGFTIAGIVSDAMVTKCTPTGSFLWAKQLGTDQGEMATGIAVDGSGNSYVSLWTQGTLFGPGLMLPGTSGSGDVAVAKIDTTGALVWGRQTGSVWHETTTGVALDAGGFILISGTSMYDDFVDMTTNDLHDVFYANVGVDDAFLIKYDPSGIKQ